MRKFTALFLCFVLCFSLNLQAFAVKINGSDYEILCNKNDEMFNTAQTVSADMGEIESKPAVSAKAVCLMEKSTGKILYSENENDRLYPASVTKIMTMLLVCEALKSGKISLSDSVQTSENAASKGGSQIWLKPGEIMTVDDMLKAAAVYSANDACTALGEYVAGSEDAFISMMNERANELGMNNTHFDNCTGLDDTTETHLTTAYDIALMGRELIGFDIIKKYSTIWMDSLRDGATELVNTNKLVRFYKGCTGLKTGTTSKAGCCVCATAERNGMELIAVVLGAGNSNDRFNSARNMLDWGFANYETVVPDIDKSLITSVSVIKGKTDNITPVLPEIAPVLIKKGDKNKITCEISVCDSVQAPVEINQSLGTVIVKFDGKELCKYKLISEKAVEKMNFIDGIKKIFFVFGKK